MEEWTHKMEHVLNNSQIKIENCEEFRWPVNEFRDISSTNDSVYQLQHAQSLNAYALMNWMKIIRSTMVSTYLRWHFYYDYVRILFHLPPDLAFLIQQHQCHCHRLHSHSNPMRPNPFYAFYFVAASDSRQRLIRVGLQHFRKKIKQEKLTVYIFLIWRQLYKRTYAKSKHLIHHQMIIQFFFY